MSENSTNVPKLRFPGFTKNWEQRKLGDFIEDYIEKTTIQNQYPVLTSSQQMGIVLQEEYFANRQVTTSENVGYFVLPKGYFTYRSRSDNDVFVFNRNDLIDKGIISYFYPVFRVKNADSDFFLRRLNFGIERQISIAAEGTGQHVLPLKKFKDVVAMFPSVQEQTKIGAFFRNLDNLITLHQCKLNHLQEQKKALLQKMFPKNGMNVPEIRFPGFTDAWEQRKLGDLLENAYQGINTAGDKVEYSESGVKILQSKHITSGNITFDDARYLDRDRYSEYLPKYVPNVDDILFANIGTIGPSAVVTEVKEFLIAWNILKMTPKKESNAKFIQLQLQRLNIKRYFESVTTGNATKFVNKDEMLRTQIIVPEKKEQSKIGEFFANLDNLITLHQRKLNHLQEQKKALLQQMFV
jgi:type I restriction enzyme S subunit